MKRRNFLKSAASVFPLALTQPIAIAADSDATLKEAHLVPAGQDIDGEARTLGFSHIFFKVSTQETGGNLFLIEHMNLVGGPPLHVHPSQEEWFYVTDGEVLFQVGDKRVRLKSGDSVLAPRNVTHGFCAAKPSKML